MLLCLSRWVRVAFGEGEDGSDLVKYSSWAYFVHGLILLCSRCEEKYIS